MASISRAPVFMSAAVLVLVLAFCVRPVRGLDVVVADANMIQVNEQQIASWVFGNISSEAQALKSLRDHADLKLDAVKQAVELTPEQSARLQLAVEGDVQRFLADYSLLRNGIKLGPMPQDQWQNLWRKVQPLRQRFDAGILGRDSLLAKTIKSVLTPEQWAAYRSQEQERQRRNYLSLVKATIASIEGKCPLTVEQRDKLTNLIMEKSTSYEFTGQRYYQMYFVLAQMSQIPEEDLKPIFQEKEWVMISRARQQGVQMIGILNQQVQEEE